MSSATAGLPARTRESKSERSIRAGFARISAAVVLITQAFNTTRSISLSLSLRVRISAVQDDAVTRDAVNAMPAIIFDRSAASPEVMSPDVTDAMSADAAAIRSFGQRLGMRVPCQCCSCRSVRRRVGVRTEQRAAQHIGACGRDQGCDDQRQREIDQALGEITVNGTLEPEPHSHPPILQPRLPALRHLPEVKLSLRRGAKDR